MNSFEDYLDFIEKQLGLQLLDWQKEILKKIYENKKFFYIPGRRHGMTMLIKAVELLEEITKENGNERQSHPISKLIGKRGDSYGS